MGPLWSIFINFEVFDKKYNTFLNNACWFLIINCSNYNKLTTLKQNKTKENHKNNVHTH